MAEETKQTSWFALHIRMCYYEQVENALQHKGYDVFSPSYVTTRVVAKRERQVRTPLFPGYMFCVLDPQNRLPVVTVSGVIGILGTGTKLTPVPTEEIEAVRRTLASGLPYEPYRLLQPGEPVQVKSGPLAGIKGVVVQLKGKSRLVITVSALNDRAVSVEVDRDTVTPLPSSGIALPRRPATPPWWKEAVC